MDKPKWIGYAPYRENYQTVIEKISFLENEYLDIELLTKLLESKKLGYDIEIYTNHDRKYKYHRDDEECEFHPEIRISLYDKKSHDEDLASYNEMLEEYNTKLAAWEKYQKEQAKQEKIKNERDEKKKRLEEYLKLKQEFEGK